jgi:hypothetical protein
MLKELSVSAFGAGREGFTSIVGFNRGPQHREGDFSNWFIHSAEDLEFLYMFVFYLDIYLVSFSPPLLVCLWFHYKKERGGTLLIAWP